MPHGNEDSPIYYLTLQILRIKVGGLFGLRGPDMGCGAPWPQINRCWFWVPGRGLFLGRQDSPQEGAADSRRSPVFGTQVVGGYGWAYDSITGIALAGCASVLLVCCDRWHSNFGIPVTAKACVAVHLRGQLDRF